ncbi:MAG: GNAT family N-acetyltransferase, partial [Caldilineaceae bacterium]|nr:GNAT family N-acetyltransferase [Caldilineaceae bacterium]
MTADLRLRRYRPTDFAPCLAIFDSNTPKYFAAHERADFAQFLQTTTEPYFVVTRDADRQGESKATEQIIGCGGYFLRDGGTVAGFSWGMVAHEYHGIGAGRFLMMARLQRICQETTAQS